MTSITDTFLSHLNGITNFSNININSGIFQGDSDFVFCILHCLLGDFVLLLFHSHWNLTEIKDLVIKHPSYMDDLRLYAKNDLKDFLNLSNTLVMT